MTAEEQHEDSVAQVHNVYNAVHSWRMERQADGLTDWQPGPPPHWSHDSAIHSEFLQETAKKKKKNPVSFLVSATNVSRWLMYFNWSCSDFFSPSLILLPGLIYFNKCKLIIRHFPNKDRRPLTHLASLQMQQMFTEAFSFFFLFFLFTRHWDFTGKIFIFKLCLICYKYLGLISMSVGEIETNQQWGCCVSDANANTMSCLSGQKALLTKKTQNNPR